MKEQEHVEQCQQMAREWFKDHQALLVSSEQKKPCCERDTDADGDCDYHPDGIWNIRIQWKNPGHWNYAIDYQITGRYVIVLGDLGEAVYGWGCQLTLEKLATFDWHYFWGKCCASETGRSYSQKVPGIKRPVVHIRAIGHFMGLKMAIEQLSAKSHNEQTHHT